MLHAERSARVEICVSETCNPVIGQEDLSLPTALADNAQTPARQVEVMALDAYYLINACTCRHHQCDCEKRRGLMRLSEHHM